MPKGQFKRRTVEQQLEDAKQKVAELEARIKAESALTVESKPIKAIVNEIKRVAAEFEVDAKAVLKLVSSDVSPRKSRKTTEENAV